MFAESIREHNNIVLWINRLTVFSIILISLTAFGQPDEIPPGYDFNKDVMYLTAPIGALMVGVYDGDFTFADLKEHGDFGLGTVNGLDGEMIALDGEFYQIRTDGVAYRIGNEALTPFAVVTQFFPEVQYFDIGALNYDQLLKQLEGMAPSKNYIYAFRLTGLFSYVKTRSVPRQSKPYVPLTEAVKNQTVFEFNDVEGTLVGFWSPAYMQGVNVPGYHFHFITKDRKAGGHVLDCIVENADVDIDYKFGFKMNVPFNNEFGNADLSTDGLDEVERPKSNLRFYKTYK